MISSELTKLYKLKPIALADLVIMILALANT